MLLRVGPASTHLTSHMLAGIAMLIFGADNVAIGSYVALKLKRLRRRLIACQLHADCRPSLLAGTSL